MSTIAKPVEDAATRGSRSRREKESARNKRQRFRNSLLFTVSRRLDFGLSLHNMRLRACHLLVSTPALRVSACLLPGLEEATQLIALLLSCVWEGFGEV